MRVKIEMGRFKIIGVLCIETIIIIFDVLWHQTFQFIDVSNLVKTSNLP